MEKKQSKQSSQENILYKKQLEMVSDNGRQMLLQELQIMQTYDPLFFRVLIKKKGKIKEKEKNNGKNG